MITIKRALIYSSIIALASTSYSSNSNAQGNWYNTIDQQQQNSYYQQQQQMQEIQRRNYEAQQQMQRTQEQRANESRNNNRNKMNSGLGNYNNPFRRY